jgi:23S rRNA (cytidine1920-2'-O)/16S rRNA (cytidine1409-2'-O)-methyltransferase
VPRQRLDQLLVERGLAPSRTRAQALVMAGRVRVGSGDSGRTNRKPGDLLASDASVAVIEKDPYVSRGAHKLEAALDAFGVSPADRVCLDVGASTGGFTDVLLQRGARHVYAVDVGRAQLAERLRLDPRVTSLERTNARTLTADVLGERVSLAVVDVSFISLSLVLGPTAATFEDGGGDVIALVKPQFEAGRGRTDGGVVRDPVVHRDVLESVARNAADLGLQLRGAIVSPLLGPAGNREFLFHLAVPSGTQARPPVPLEDAWLGRFDELAAG